MTEEESHSENIPGFISVTEAGKILGVSRRCINDYIQEERLHRFKAGRTLMLKEEEVREFQRHATGRPRTRMPPWRLPVGDNLQYLTVVSASILPGQGARFEEKLQEIHNRQLHLLPGTVNRFIARNEEVPDNVQLVFIWRSTIMPDKAGRAAEIAALQAEFAGIIDWENSWSEFGKVLEHA